MVPGRLLLRKDLPHGYFSCAKDLHFFENQNRVSFDLLKTVQRFRAGIRSGSLSP